MKKILKILIIIFSLNILGMESDLGPQANSKNVDAKSSLVDHVVIDIQNTRSLSSKKKLDKNFKNVSTDSEFINFLPPEIWHDIFEYLDIKDKKTLKTILYFFAPRIGVLKNLAKIIAVNISNHAALRATSIGDWQERINNPYKIWGNFKKYKSLGFAKNSAVENSRELIKKYLKLLNNSFIEKIELYNQALTSGNKKEDIEKLWKIIESEVEDYSDSGRKKAYLEIEKATLLGKYYLVGYKEVLIPLIFLIIPPSILLLKIFDRTDNTYIFMGIVYGMFVLSIGLFVIMFGGPCANSTKNLLCGKKHISSGIKLSKNLICVESRMQNMIKNYNKIEEFEEVILEFLNSKLNETVEEKDLDKILIAALSEPINTSFEDINLKEEE